MKNARTNGNARPGGCPGPSATEFHIREPMPRALYESSPSGILVTGQDGRIHAANPAACLMFGRTEAMLRTLVRLDLVLPSDPRLPVLLAEHERTGCYHGGLTMVRGDGSSFEAEVISVVFPVGDETYTSMVIRDVTEWKRTEARANDQEKWLDFANEAILATDLAHRITYWNRSAERLGGRSAKEVMGRSLSDLLSDDGITDPRVFAAATRMTDWRGTISCRLRDGTPRILAVSVTVLRDAHGRMTGRLCVGTDITEQAKLQEKYERALRLQSVGLLAAGVAHDFNNILTAISMSVPMLKDRLEHPDDLALLELIQACVSRGAAVTRQILGCAQGVGGEARAIPVPPILREVADIVRETFPRSIALETDISPDLWPVLANPTQIHQLLLNLCVNARDAMPQGGRLRLGGCNRVLDEAEAARIEGAQRGAWLVLHVEDTGTGIAPELLPRIWEPFYTTKSGERGTGLGLSTVKDIVETHAGFIAVETMPGRGTAFRIYLPARGSGIPYPEPETPSELSNGTGEAILVVEDERGIRDGIKAALTKAGYHVTTAGNGDEALQVIRGRPQPFDLVLTDIDMPVLNGVKLASILSEIQPALPVVAMSGLSFHADGVDPRQFSGGYLPKPFRLDELSRVIRQALEHKRRAA